jgi:probable rRNA maturation factor
MSIAVVIEDAAWRREPGWPASVRRAVRAALKKSGRSGSLTVLLSGDSRLKELNRSFRGKNKPTNVLSFPAAETGDDYLGDIAISHATAAKEAAAEKKTLADHVSHLTVHGVLHLAGFDHIRAADAAVMEAAEIEILAGLGIPDPYQPPGENERRKKISRRK